MSFKVVPNGVISDGWLGLDNGPEVNVEIKVALSDCETIIWNDPKLVFKSPQFAKVTYEIAECLAELAEMSGMMMNWEPKGGSPGGHCEGPRGGAETDQRQLQ
mmetsp:Transcript_10282/g.27591  ORF Transcript_10282/g.27591 Transcript_10282/m.27591 type:complete len:103 (-) Transcript_10282:911-1219(-)